MKILKGFLLSILSLLLFSSLSLFGILFAMNQTLLDADYVAKQVDRIDMPALTRQIADQYIIPQVPPDYAFLKEPVYASFGEFAPSLKEQMRTAVRSAYDYFQGPSQRLNLTISFDTLRSSLQTRARQAFLQNPPAQVAQLPRAQQEQFFNQLYEQYSRQIIPPSLDLNESTMDQKTQAQIRSVKQYVAWADTSYKLLMLLIAIMILAIFLIHANLKTASRELGISLLIFGVLQLVGVLIAGSVLPASLPIAQVPPALDVWLAGLITDVLSPLRTFSIVLVIVGAVLLAFSLVYRGKKPKPATEVPEAEAASQGTAQ